MLLKSLELQGFKSFADKTVFEFSDGVSAIVGPNGSGKSNVVDAIRWVLGEQSAKTLRGGKMEDVIFSGSSTRKPVGMAKVTLTLNNSNRLFLSDYDEIEVTRTLYRSGESNYELNRNNCRLRDIQELFMDTGLGKDGFSVIGQGKIDEILTLHADERRGLLEEAAGISKYKYRKREAERRLAATGEDMDRLDDLLYELEQRLEPLRKQAEDVAAYRAIEAEEKALALAWLVSRAEDMSKQKNEQDDCLSHCEKEMAKAVSAHHNATADHLEKRERLAILQEEQDDIARRFIEAVEKREELAREGDMVKERLRQLTNRLEEDEGTFLKLSDALAQGTEELSYLADALEKTASEADDLKADVAVMENLVKEAHEIHSGQMEALQVIAERQFKLLRRQADARNDMTKLRQQKTFAEQQLSRQEKAVVQAEADIMSWQDAHQQLLTVGQQIERAEREARETVVSGQEQLKHRTKQRDALLAQREGLEKRQLQAQSRLDALNELEASGEGYYAGVQAVVRAMNRGQLEHIDGTVSQLLAIPEAYAAAIESALGGAAQHLICRDDDSARRAIEWLKRERRGRATFLPLNTVTVRQPVALPDHPAVVGRAIDLVQFDDSYRSAISQLLAHIIVVKDLPQAVQLAKTGGFKQRFVTLDGELVNPGGSMTGGRQKKDHSVVRRASERLTLKDQLERLDVEIQKVEDLLIQNKARFDEAQMTFDKAQEFVREQTFSVQENRLNIENSEKEGKRLQRLEKLLQEEIGQLEEDIALCNEKLVKQENQLEVIQLALHRCEEEKNERENSQKDRLEEDEIREQEWQNLRIRLAEVNEKLRNRRKAYEEEARRQEREDRNLANLRDRIHDNRKEVQVLETQLEDISLSQVQARNHYLRTQEAQEESRRDLHNAQELEAKAASLLTETATQKNETEKAMEKAREKAGRISEGLAQIVGQLQEQFAYSLEEAAAVRDDTIDLTSAQTRLKRLRSQRLAYGALNFTAPEEYEDVLKRSSFLAEQLKDLADAKERLVTIIAEMEKTMTERFAETYHKVNEHFSDIFQKMFSGGQAHLVLSMPDRLLETGVEVVAQPPGKKERPLTLLSGGERAMTAIALLFALLEVRPSPFVILDEIEAALDSANVERFARFIVSYGEHTQFIVISHRQGTMEAAKVLYGVTMDRDGTSRLVSVRVEDYIDEE